MDTFTVVATLESTDTPDGVDMKWYSGHDPIKALLAVTQVLDHHLTPGDHPHPVRLMSVRLDVTEAVEIIAYRCTQCGMRDRTDDLTVIGRNCSATNFERAHIMVPITKES